MQWDLFFIFYFFGELYTFSGTSNLHFQLNSLILHLWGNLCLQDVLVTEFSALRSSCTESHSWRTDGSFFATTNTLSALQLCVNVLVSVLHRWASAHRQLSHYIFLDVFSHITNVGQNLEVFKHGRNCGFWNRSFILELPNCMLYFFLQGVACPKARP